jgi:signal transduction histidine kinase
MVAIEDSGIGIAPEHQKRIFDRFFRVDGDGGRYASGSGLGLSLAAWIAEQHKTSITVESALARGSSFQIKLVRVASGDDPDSSFETAESKSPESIVTSAK